MAALTVEYLADAEVGPAQDADIRALLSRCFTGDDDWVFAHRRWFKEPPRHRWMLRDERGALAAHIAMHDKRVGTKDGEVRVAGLAEVAVRPDHRGRGHTRLLIARMHAFARGVGIPFSMLFGDAKVYASSAYVPAPNPLTFLDLKTRRWRTETVKSAMVAELLDVPWPEGDIDLRGPLF